MAPTTKVKGEEFSHSTWISGRRRVLS